MFKPHQQAAALAILGGLFLAPGTPSKALARDEKSEAEAKKLVEFQEKTNKKLGEIQDDIKKLTELLTGKKDKDGFIMQTEPGVVAQLKQLQDKLALLEADLNKLRAQPSTSLKPVSPVAIGDVVAGKATVRIVNEYPVQISMVINGTSYPVPPSKVVDVPVASGEFTYQLIQAGVAPTVSKIKDKEIVTLRIK